MYDVGDYPASLRRALDVAGYDELRAAQAARRAADDPIALGIGLATYVEVTAAMQTPELASVELADDGGLDRDAAGRRRTGRATTRRGR